MLWCLSWQDHCIPAGWVGVCRRVGLSLSIGSQGPHSLGPTHSSGHSAGLLIPSPHHSRAVLGGAAPVLCEVAWAQPWPWWRPLLVWPCLGLAPSPPGAPSHLTDQAHRHSAKDSGRGLGPKAGHGQDDFFNGGKSCF